jgi:hypothetical protein
MSTILTQWRRLGWVTWRQHRGALIIVFGLFALAAAVMAATGLDARAHAAFLYSLAQSSSSPYVWQLRLLGSVLELQPVLAGLLLGAPLLAQEAESGSLRFTWTQDVGPCSSLAAKTILIASGLGVTAAAVSWEFAWWSRRVTAVIWYHVAAPQFSYFPWSYAAWTVFGFSLGVLIGAITRRTVPALIGTLAGYALVFYLKAFDQLPGNGLSGFWTRFPFRFGDGYSQYPGEFHEFGLLILASGLLVASTAVLVGRRSV